MTTETMEARQTMDSVDFGANVSAVFGWEPSKGNLLRLQLGDVFFKGKSDPVFTVINAGCDLMFTPESVSTSRPPKPSNTVYLLPGQFRDTKDCPPKGLTTGLIKFDKTWKCIVWDSKKVVAIPHDHVERYLRGNGYRHELRLRTARAIELQQQVFHGASRIGLEVQPPLCEGLTLRLIVRTAEEFVILDDQITEGAVRFHTPKLSVVVFKPEAISTVCALLLSAIEDESDSKSTIGRIVKAESLLRDNAAQLAKTPMAEPKSDKPQSIRPAKGFSGCKLDNVGVISWQGQAIGAGWNHNLAAVIGIEENK